MLTPRFELEHNLNGPYVYLQRTDEISSFNQFKVIKCLLCFSTKLILLILQVLHNNHYLIT